MASKLKVTIIWISAISVVPLGETWNMQLNITDPGADYIYLKKECQKCAENRLKKLDKGETGNGTCYKEVPGCQEYCGFHHIGENVIEVTIRLLLKSMEGAYGLYYYCKGIAHNCNRDGPIKKFFLIIEDARNTPQREKATTEESPTQITGSAMNIQQSAWLAKLTSLLVVIVPYWALNRQVKSNYNSPKMEPDQKSEDRQDHLFGSNACKLG